MSPTPASVGTSTTSGRADASRSSSGRETGKRSWDSSSRRCATGTTPSCLSHRQVSDLTSTCVSDRYVQDGTYACSFPPLLSICRPLCTGKNEYCSSSKINFSSEYELCHYAAVRVSSKMKLIRKPCVEWCWKHEIKLNWDLSPCFFYTQWI